MIEGLIFGLFWFSLFCFGFSEGKGLLESRKTTILGIVSFMAGLTLCFYLLAIGNISILSAEELSSIGSSGIGILGLFLIIFLGSSLGIGYLAGKIYQRM